MFQGPGNFQGPELLAAPGIFQAPWKIPGGSLSPVRHAVKGRQWSDMDPIINIHKNPIMNWWSWQKYKPAIRSFIAYQSPAGLQLLQLVWTHQAVEAPWLPPAPAPHNNRDTSQHWPHTTTDETHHNAGTTQHHGRNPSAAESGPEPPA